MSSKDEDKAPRTDATADRAQGSAREDVQPEQTVALEEVGTYKLKEIKEEDAQVPGLYTLQVVADGTFQASTGEILRTGDVKRVNAQDAKVLLDAKVNGKPAFKRV